MGNVWKSFLNQLKNSLHFTQFEQEAGKNLNPPPSSGKMADKRTSLIDAAAYRNRTFQLIQNFFDNHQPQSRSRFRKIFGVFRPVKF
jgi:hypothetical protein